MRILATLILAAFLYQAKPTPAYQAAAQNDNRATNENAQAAPTIEQHLSDKEPPSTHGNARPASDKTRSVEWVQIFINTLVALAVFWTAWTYNEQRKLMGMQLEALNRQAGMMSGQLGAMDRQGRAMTESLYQNQRAVEAAERNVEIARDSYSDARNEAYHQREMMQRQLDLMSKQTEAAQAAAKTAELNTRYTQRAYVTITKRQGSFGGFSLTIENSGNTPALAVEVQVVTGLNFTPPELPDSSEGWTRIGILAPHDSYEMLVTIPDRELTEEEREWFDDPQLGFNWWCVGSISYRDILQTSASDFRQTDFAFYQDRVGHNIQAWVDGNSMTEHYSADHKQENPN